jgi:rfaE bifunctional protein nucleotidyltransferase chain/domain
MKRKIRSLNDLVKIRRRLRKERRKVVLTNGCFDLLHNGHIHLFREAKKLGDVLVVAVNDDSSIRKIKGPSRPIFPLEERLEILEALGEVDYLVSFPEETPQKVINSLLPDVLVKGGDWRREEVVGRKEVEAEGGKVVIIPYFKGHSSTKIIERILKMKTR